MIKWMGNGIEELQKFLQSMKVKVIILLDHNTSHTYIQSYIHTYIHMHMYLCSLQVMSMTMSY